MMQKLSILTASSLLLASFIGGCSGPNKATQAVAAPTAPVEAPRRRVASSCSDTGKTDTMREADVDGDGRPDLFKYYKEVDDAERPGERKTVLVRQDIDLNWDGRLDICRYFAANGKVDREEFDLDYDGKVDEIRTYKDGIVTLAERDRNNDGRFDVIRRYNKGKLIQKETDTNDDGQIDRWEYYDGDLLDRVGVDVDHDGKVDRWAKSSAR